MRVLGYYHNALPFVRVAVFSPAIRRPLDVHFLLDSGAARSTLNEREAEWLMIDRRQLRRAPQDVLGVGGRVETWLISQGDLIFETAEGLFHTESRNEMATLVHRTRHRALRFQLQHMPSVIGQDILSRYAFVQDPRTGLVLLTDEFLNL